MLGNSGHPHSLSQSQRRFSHRFIGERERAPVHGNGMTGSGFFKNSHRLLRIHVHAFHEPTWSIRTDRNHAEIQRPELLSDFRKGFAISAVTRVPEFFARTLDVPTAPVAAISIERRPRREVLRGRCCDADVSEIRVLPPCQFFHIVKSLFSEPCLVPGRNQDPRVVRKVA